MSLTEIIETIDETDNKLAKTGNFLSDNGINLALYEKDLRIIVRSENNREIQAWKNPYTNEEIEGKERDIRIQPHSIDLGFFQVKKTRLIDELYVPFLMQLNNDYQEDFTRRTNEIIKTYKKNYKNYDYNIIPPFSINDVTLDELIFTQNKNFRIAKSRLSRVGMAGNNFEEKTNGEATVKIYNPTPIAWEFYKGEKLVQLMPITRDNEPNKEYYKHTAFPSDKKFDVETTNKATTIDYEKMFEQEIYKIKFHERHNKFFTKEILLDREFTKEPWNHYSFNSEQNFTLTDKEAAIIHPTKAILFDAGFTGKCFPNNQKTNLQYYSFEVPVEKPYNNSHQGKQEFTL